MTIQEKIVGNAIVYCQDVVGKSAREVCKIIGGATASSVVAAVAADCAQEWSELSKQEFLDVCSMSWDNVAKSKGWKR